MKLPSLLLLFILIAIAAFAAFNWDAFLAPTDLSIGFTTVSVPLGLVMLCILATITILFLAFVVYLQGSVLLEARRHSRELQANRELADKAEASRFTELRAFLATEMTKQSFQSEGANDKLLARIDKLEVEFQSFIEQSGNTLAAYIGELEDRIEKPSTPSSIP